MDQDFPKAFGTTEGEPVVNFVMLTKCATCGSTVGQKNATWKAKDYNAHVARYHEEPVSHVDHCDNCLVREG